MRLASGRFGATIGIMRRLVIAGLASGSGKTTVACALLAAFARRGWNVQPFKIGPDYIDPGHHAHIAGRASRTLDSVLLPPGRLRALFTRAVSNADVAIVEGVMGLFDGRTGQGEVGSTAQVAKLIDAPVVIVLDVAKVGRTAGSTALGACRFDPALRIVGFILNRVASASHASICTEAVEAATDLPVLGALPRTDALALPERRLGLVPAEEMTPSPDFRLRLASSAEAHLALDRLWVLSDAGAVDGGDDPFPMEPQGRRASIALAQDRAFSFYYPDSLDLLRAWGAELVPYSPLIDHGLPPGTQGVYLGGGFPELSAAELAANLPMHVALREAARIGLPIYAECGGLMYLGRTLTDFAGQTHTMVGLAAVDSRMDRERVTVGYRTATTLRATPLLAAGATVVGHEFHYSHLSEPPAPASAAYRITEPAISVEGYADGNTLASYVHLHFGSDPLMAQRFVQACARQAPV
ncbi:MAG: cobB [Chloroflexi bacterium]|nr:cobB [Chloroflexota bacterium]